MFFSPFLSLPPSLFPSLPTLASQCCSCSLFWSSITTILTLKTSNEYFVLFLTINSLKFSTWFLFITPVVMLLLKFSFVSRENVLLHIHTFIIFLWHSCQIIATIDSCWCLYLLLFLIRGVVFLDSWHDSWIFLAYIDLDIIIIDSSWSYWIFL